jgi:uncharacterized protein (DUF488 family)
MLYTIGYEGSSLPQFISTIWAHRVSTLIDIRDRAQSRKKGFSKSGLRDAVERQGIDYVHIRSLGDPKEGRVAARAGDFDRFRQIYFNVLSGSDAQEGLGKAVSLVSKGRACLMCYERDFLNCHRKIVSDEIARILGCDVSHLQVIKDEFKRLQSRRVLHCSESTAA